MVNVKLNNGDWYDLGRVTKKSIETLKNGIKVKVIKTTKGEIIFGSTENF